jgi:Zn-dependent M16 (insulinase) family peptidase
METFGFELVSEQKIHELNCLARLYRHQKTGARLLSVENDDENKVFGITFRTPPADSTGLPHIMEHAVLCGSRKYLLKEPFVELLKGSLNTFLNAFTYPDRTCYPVASQNLQDYYNLVDVYLDAVFYPLIPPQTLQQEGWHYELESLDAPLTYKGVVFNEMKGAYSSPDSLLARFTQESLFPDTPYGVDSGGDPQAIPYLTYEQFKSFHETYYHPSNAYIFMYGDDDPQTRLRLVNDYLKEFDFRQVDSAIPLQPAFSEPRTLIAPYAASEEGESNKGYLTVNWLLAENADPQVTLGLSILSHILIGTPASPLRKALIDSGLGEDLVGGGLEPELRQMFFSTGLKGLAVSDQQQVLKKDQVEALIFETLEALAEDGIDPETVAASLNTTEFRLRENNTGSFPRGLLLMLRALTSWLYDRDPLEALAFETPLAAIKARLEAGDPYFEGLIRRYLLENPHRTSVVLRPDPELQARQEAAEAEHLSSIRNTLSQAELQAIMDNAAALKSQQETPDLPHVLAMIPSLKLEDLDRENKRIPLEVSEQAGARLLYHDLFTNGILYLDIGFDLHVIPQELLPYLPLFGRALVEIGTENQDFVRLSQRIGRSTGGIHPSIFTSAVLGQEHSAAWLFLRGKAVTSQAGELLAILRDVLLSVRLDNPERFRQMVLESKADHEAMLVPAGHRVVNTRLKSRFDESAWLDEQFGGITHLLFLRELAEQVDRDWPSVLHKLEMIRKLLINRQRMLCNITLDAAGWAAFQPQLAGFLAELPAAPAGPQTWHREPLAEDEGLVIPAQVNYVGKGANLYRHGYQLDGSIFVVLNFLRTTYLWEKIRVQGGAYGAFAAFDHRSGTFSYLSYRDPNLLQTLATYDHTPAFLQQIDGSRLSQEEITKSIIGVIGDFDAYQLPDAKGFISMTRYLSGETDETRHARRQQVLATSREDFRRFGQVLEQVSQHGQVVVLGSQEGINQANAEGGDWLTVTRIL